MTLRELNVEDLAQVEIIQKDAYKSEELLEDLESFKSKMTLFPQGSVGYFDGERLVAYLFSHPWRLETIVPINTTLTSLPEQPDCLYLHDLSVLSAYNGQGIAKKLVNHIINLAQKLHLEALELVAVQNSDKFWAKFGFEVVNRFEYAPGVSAAKMIRQLEGR